MERSTKTSTKAADSYKVALYDHLSTLDARARKDAYATLVNSYYDLATDFYEYGWGQSFHFAPRRRAETLKQSIVWHEQWLADQTAIAQGTSVLDVGCGVGGPMRAISRHTGAAIVGLNNNGYQVARGEALNRQQGAGQCSLVKGDFMQMPFHDEAFDRAYAIEATVHAPDLRLAYLEVKRVLKPGGLFGTYEWCMTSQFNSTDAAHAATKRQIEVSNGIPEMGTSASVLQAMEEAGLIILDHEDRAGVGDLPWWDPLAPSRLSVQSLRSSPMAGKLLIGMLASLEFAGLVRRGSAATARMLCLGGQALVAGGQSGIFTPAYFVLARKPV